MLGEVEATHLPPLHVGPHVHVHLFWFLISELEDKKDYKTTRKASQVQKELKLAEATWMLFCVPVRYP